LGRDLTADSIPFGTRTYGFEQTQITMCEKTSEEEVNLVKREQRTHNHFHNSNNGGCKNRTLNGWSKD